MWQSIKIHNRFRILAKTPNAKNPSKRFYPHNVIYTTPKFRHCERIYPRGKAGAAAASLVIHKAKTLESTFYTFSVYTRIHFLKTPFLRHCERIYPRGKARRSCSFFSNPQSKRNRTSLVIHKICTSKKVFLESIFKKWILAFC